MVPGMRRFIIVMVGIFVGCFLTSSSFAQKTKFQSIFIYNFSKYIKWPDDYNKGKFVIGVLGETSLVDDLQAMAATKKQANGLEFEIRTFSSIDEITHCNLLFITNKHCDQIDDLKSALAGSPTLIIADKKGMAKNGAIINFIEHGGKIRFELNQSEAKKIDVVISSSLTNLAILV